MYTFGHFFGASNTIVFTYQKNQFRLEGCVYLHMHKHVPVYDRSHASVRLCSEPMRTGAYVRACAHVYPIHPLTYFNFQLKPNMLTNFELALLNSCSCIILLCFKCF